MAKGEKKTVAAVLEQPRRLVVAFRQGARVFSRAGGDALRSWAGLKDDAHVGPVGVSFPDPKLPGDLVMVPWHNIEQVTEYVDE